MVKSISIFSKQAGVKSAIAILLVLLWGCVDKKSKQKLFAKTSICNRLWREKFRVFSGGAHSAELYSDYITDSTNFRIYIGSHDEHSSFDYQCIGDTVVILKFTHNENKGRTVSKKSTFSLSELRKEHKFE